MPKVGHVAQINGDREMLVSKIQKRCGRSRKQAEGDVASGWPRKGATRRTAWKLGAFRLTLAR